MCVKQRICVAVALRFVPQEFDGILVFGMHHHQCALVLGGGLEFEYFSIGDRIAQCLALFGKAESKRGRVSPSHRDARRGGKVIGHFNAGPGGLGNMDMAVDPARHCD